MIFDFISGEASTQEGGDKFAKCLAEDADLAQKEKKSVVEKIKDFFTKRLDEMNITLRQVFDSQELETGHHTSQTQVQRVARQLKKSTGSKMDTPRLMVQLKGLFDYIGNNDDVTFSSVMDQAKEIAHELLDSTPEHTVRDEYAQEVLDTLRGMAITLSDEQKAETAYHYNRYGSDLLFLYFASKSTAISAVTPKGFCFLLLFV